jgi:transmembrane sensor
MDKTQLLALAQKYMEGIATEEEIQRLHEWYDKANDDDIEMVFTNRQESQQAMGNRLYTGIQEKMKDRGRVRRLKVMRYAVAASVAALLLITTTYLFTDKKPAQQATLAPSTQSPQKITDVLPGGDKAKLLLANGHVIILDSLQDGAINNEAGIAIRKEEGRVVCNASNAQTGQAITYNTIITPRGGQYQVVLPDGSKVWLNAASSLRFPIAFVNGERNVSITGEAYFEVAKNKSQPFIVDVNGRSSVEVLGTHFNIMAYDDEEDTRTTLLEGSVVVKSEVGGQKSEYTGPTSDFRPPTPVLLKPGEMARTMNVSAVLKILETAGVHFRLESGSTPDNTKLVVLP